MIITIKLIIMRLIKYSSIVYKKEKVKNNLQTK